MTKTIVVSAFFATRVKNILYYEEEYDFLEHSSFRFAYERK